MEVDLIQIKNLKTYFFQGKGLLSKWFGQGLKIVHAVDGVSLTIKKGRTFGLVGESGCGKSTLGNTIFRLVEPLEGEILFQGRDIVKMDQKELREFRQKAQIIFQDQFGCMNPRMTVGQAIEHPAQIHMTDLNADQRRQAVYEILDAVGGDTDVYLDSGIRSGQDVLKALALGAKGTMIGRAFVYGLGAMGQQGVTTALEVIQKELDTTMALCGERKVTELGRHNLLVPEDFGGRWQG